jgi:hypothetical protein
LDPVRSGGIEAKLRALDQTGMNWTKPNPEMATARTPDFLDEKGLREQVPWMERARGFASNPRTDCSSDMINVNGRAFKLDGYVRTLEFGAAYDALTGSWLALKLRQRAGETLSDGLLDLHEAALRFAEVIRRAGSGTYLVDDGPRLSKVPLVVPASWRAGRAAAAGAGENGTSAVQPEEKPKTLESLQMERSMVVDEARALEDVMIKATLLVDAASHDAPGPPNLDQSFLDALKKRLPAARAAVLDNFITARGLIPDFGDFLGALASDVGAKLTTANDLCKQIRVFEQDEVEKLPSARTPTSKTRPSIRALGWGDLIVVREELVGYEAHEVSHIENTLAGESTEHELEQRHTVQNLVETETTTEKTSEHDLQTTDRFEIQAEASKSIASDFSVQAGVNTSGKYGLTQVDTSVAANLSRSTNEATRSATQTAQEVISKAVERTQTTVRELRRTVTTDSIRELAKHAIDNTTKGVGSSPQPRSGIYLWVEKIQRLQLYQYGKRLLIEFEIPEPGLSLIEAAQPVKPDAPKPLPLAVGPNDIDEANYLCLTELYQARDVAPPPPLLIQIGYSLATEVNEGASDPTAEATEAKLVAVPPGYQPISGRYATTGRGRTDEAIDYFHAHLSVGGQVILDSAVELARGEAAEGYPSYQGRFLLEAPTVTDDHGIPIAVRISGADDNASTMNVYIKCLRSPAVLDAWRLDTYQHLVQAHDELEANYREALTQARFGAQTAQAFGGHPSEVNRAIEREELKKWAIKLMRTCPYSYDAVIQEQGFQEIDPVVADEQAPVVRFFEQCFEWEQMSYILEPYFWGRRASWALRQNISVPDDPQHQAFLRAGSARVIVPVTPDHEQFVLHYLGSEPALPEWDPILVKNWNPKDPHPPKQRILPTAMDLASTSPAAVTDRTFPNLWLELLEAYKPDVLRGSGRLDVRHGNARVKLVDSIEKAGTRDIGREIYIDGDRYEIVSTQNSGDEFDLDRPYQGPTSDAAMYATGSVKMGAPWEIRIPTDLLVLSSNKSDLTSVV